MYSKVIYIVKSNLGYYPPCMAQIQEMADLGVNIEVWYGSCDQVAVDILDARGVPHLELTDPRGKVPGKLDIANNWLSFRNSLKRELKRIDSESTLLWFGNAETSMPMTHALLGYHYISSALELYDDHPAKLRLLGPICQRAEAVTACELTRAYIMRYWWHLKELPTVFPNKPYGVTWHRDMPLTTDDTRRIASELNGKRFIIFQGIFQKYEYLAALAKALNDMESDLWLVLMGIDNDGIGPMVKKLYPRTLVFGSVPAPTHLEITSRAWAGLVYYDDSILNKAFCAPNKIFEYSAFGLPMLANRIPGLMGTVGAAGAAECVDFEPSSLESALRRIDSGYGTYSEHSRAFFDSVDNGVTMRRLLTRLGVTMGGGA